MGIRFLCPNGHRLNVKSHLAGKRGICPDCEARFVIPAEGGGAELQRAEVAPETNGLSPPTSEQPDVEMAPPVPPPAAVSENAEPAPPPPVASTATLPDLWYVNSAGEQFGPANTETFQAWVSAGRVPEDSLVWRTGWDQWKRGNEVIAELGLPLVPSVEVSATPLPKMDPPATALPTDNYHTRQRRRRDRAKKITMALSAVVFLLLVVLVVVLIK